MSEYRVKATRDGQVREFSSLAWRNMEDSKNTNGWKKLIEAPEELKTLQPGGQVLTPAQTEAAKTLEKLKDALKGSNFSIPGASSSSPEVPAAPAPEATNNTEPTNEGAEEFVFPHGLDQIQPDAEKAAALAKELAEQPKKEPTAWEKRKAAAKAKADAEAAKKGGKSA